MHRPHTAMLLAALAALPWAATVHAEVQVRLTAHRVTQDARGQERLASAEHVRPGEIVEYRATYHNDGTSGVQKLVATLPIPNGMEYVPSTASPAAITASLDGKTYAPLPLTRTVRLSDGREATREVPPSEYRFLRWSIGALGAKQERVVQARARVASLVSSAAPSSR